MDFKNTNAEKSTITRDLDLLTEQTGNIYETLVALSKRSNVLSSELKEELSSKLAEFATTGDALEETFENREQIEISRFYERLPKPHSIAVQELLDAKLKIQEPAPKEEEEN